MDSSKMDSNSYKCVCVCVCVCACVYSYIPNNTTPFALNLLSQINFTDIQAGAFVLNSS